MVTACRCQFVHIHSETAVARDVNTDLIRTPHFCAQTRTQTVSHRAEAAGCQKRPWHGIFVILSSPHLMLSNIRRDHCIAAGDPVNLLHNVRTGQCRMIIIEWELFLQVSNVLHPRRMFLLFQLFVDPAEHFL